MTPRCVCGAHVSEAFARVLGDNDGQVHGCLDCETSQAAIDGVAAGLERSHVRRTTGGQA